MSQRGKRKFRSDSLPESAPIFAALGDETRLRLIGALCVGGAMSIAQLTAESAYTRQAITKHLDVLAAAGLVRDAKVGRERRWELDTSQLLEARRFLEVIEAHWDSALQRLKSAVEQ